MPVVEGNMFKKITVCLTLIIAAHFLTAKADAARLYIDPPTGNYTLGQQFQARVILDTEGSSTAGTDIYLKFNPQIMEVEDIQAGEIYNQYLGKSIDNQNGALSLSGIISLNDNVGYTGEGTFATITFKGLTLGISPVSFDFTPGDKNDSNVAVLANSDDQLTDTTGANYTIVSSGGNNGGSNDGNNGGSSGSDSGSGSGSGTGGNPPSELPKSGSVSTTIKAVGAGLGTLLLSLILLL